MVRKSKKSAKKAAPKTAAKKTAKKAATKKAKKVAPKLTKKPVKKVAKKTVKKRAKKPLSALTKLEQALFTRMVELDELATDMGLAGAVEPKAKKPRKKSKKKR